MHFVCISSCKLNVCGNKKKSNLPCAIAKKALERKLKNDFIEIILAMWFHTTIPQKVFCLFNRFVANSNLLLPN